MGFTVSVSTVRQFSKIFGACRLQAYAVSLKTD